MNTTKPVAKPATKQRVQFDFSVDALKRLESMQALLDAPTKAEVVRNALKVYEWLLTQIDRDGTIEIQDKDGKTQFRIPVSVLLS